MLFIFSGTKVQHDSLDTTRIKGSMFNQHFFHSRFSAVLKQLAFSPLFTTS